MCQETSRCSSVLSKNCCPCNRLPGESSTRKSRVLSLSRTRHGCPLNRGNLNMRDQNALMETLFLFLFRRSEIKLP